MREPSWWVREDYPGDATPAGRRHAYGPRLTIQWIETHIFDGGCPLHPRPVSADPAARLLAFIFASCSCVAALHVVLSWWWGRTEWWHVWEWRWIARLHPRHQAPHAKV